MHLKRDGLHAYTGRSRAPCARLPAGINLNTDRAVGRVETHVLEVAIENATASISSGTEC
jgi:hypothetical protein